MRQDVCNNGQLGLTWEQLVAAEPRLASLLEEVRAARLDDGDEYELEGVWGQFKDRIAGLVGWHRRQGEPLLQTEAAYRTAYQEIQRGRESISRAQSTPGLLSASRIPERPTRSRSRLRSSQQQRAEPVRGTERACINTTWRGAPRPRP